MSTILYGRVTTTQRKRIARRRDAVALSKSADDEEESAQEKATALAQRIASLVPAEVLAGFGIVLAVATKQQDDGSTVVTDPGLLKWSLPILGITSVVLYLIGRLPDWNWGPDVARMLIAPGAFLAWTLLMGTGALALWPWFSSVVGGRAFLVGAVLAAIALALTVRLKSSEPSG